MIGELLALGALMAFSTNMLVVRVAADEAPYEWGFFVALISQLVVAVGFVLVTVAGRSGDLEWDWVGVGLFALGGVFSTYLGRLAMFRVIAGMGPSRASAFQILQPVFAALLAFALLGQTLTPLEISLLLLILIGLLLVNRSRAQVEGEAAAVRDGRIRHRAAPEPSGTVATRSRTMTVAATFVGRHALVLVALGGGLAYGFSNVLRSAAVQRWPEVFVGTAIGILLPVALYLWRHVRPRAIRAQWRTTSRRGLLLYATSGALMMLAQASLIGSMQYLPVAIANAMAVSLPIAVMPMSMIFLRRREHVTPLAAVGALLAWVAVLGFLLV